MFANNSSGFFNSSKTSLLRLLAFPRSDSASEGDKEKKATSEPEIRAEHPNKRNTTIISIIIGVLIG
jgi:hypothetical protein